MLNNEINGNIVEFIANSPKLKLDVRETLAGGVDPFHLIMDHISILKEGEVFHLLNSFEPMPLYTVLAKRGFDHYTEVLDSVFHIYFFKPVDKGNASVDDNKTPSAQTERPDVIEMDVRDLEPPEPMIKILGKVRELDEKTILLVHHHREPMMLYEKLEEIGFQAVTTKINDNYYKVVISKKD
ncbi:MAG: DUF2249 domain-containing protein [Bacteroidetes bacterium]|nr:DUF2249 domain-containing protein [Bacteroidota bacterium]